MKKKSQNFLQGIFTKIKGQKFQLLAFVIILCLVPVFLINLNGSSLEEFDEGWYAVVAKNIIKNQTIVPMVFDNKPYTDHPPLGFILMAVSMITFGVSEFSVRLPSALAGIGSLVFIYLTGKKLFNERVGLVAALILGSSIWFLFRARSGNLDSLLVFFFISTFYFTVKLEDNPNWIYLLAISSAGLFLIKSFIGIIIIPPIVAYLIINRPKVPLIKIFLSSILFIELAFYWYKIYQVSQTTNFDLLGHQFELATRSGHSRPINFLDLWHSLTFIYLHEGIRKWFYPAVISFVASVPFIFKNKNLIPIYIWALILLYGFLSNDKTEIWHLLPLYTPLALITAFFWDKLAESFFNFVKLNSKTFLLYVFVVLPVLAICLFQIGKARNELNLFGKNINGLAEISKVAKNYPQQMFIDTDSGIPAIALFYSDKPVTIIHDQPKLFQTQKRPFLLLTQDWRLKGDNIGVNEYKLLSQYDDHVLVLAK